MVMDYYGVANTYDDILSYMNFYDLGPSIGLSNPQVATYMVNKGLNVEIDTLNPYLFNALDIGKPQSVIYQKVKNIQVTNPAFESVQTHFIEFMDAGGKLNPAILTKKNITDEIDLGHPVMLPLITRAIHGHETGYNFHMNVVIGYEENKFIVHDPSSSKERAGGTNAINQDLAMNTFHMTAFADFDNASIIKIAP
jgi:hypothetical protein